MALIYAIRAQVFDLASQAFETVLVEKSRIFRERAGRFLEIIAFYLSVLYHCVEEGLLGFAISGCST